VALTQSFALVLSLTNQHKTATCLNPR